MIMINF